MAVIENKKRPEVLFQLKNYSKDEEFLIGITTDHTIVFVLQGRISITSKNSGEILFDADTMFFCSKTLSSYKVCAKENTTIIELNTQFVLPFMDSVRLNDIIAKYTPETIELSGLKFDKTLKTFLSNVIYYGRNNISSGYLQDIKVKEFIFLLRMLYDYESLAKLFSTLSLSQNLFRVSVFSNYTHGCTVNSLADKCYMTTKTFTRKFKTEFKTTPHKWIIQQKIKGLEYMLTHKTAPLHEIIELFLFSNTSELLLFCRKHDINTELVKNRNVS